MSLTTKLITLGCGNSDCVNRNNRYFCSTNCKYAAVINKFITDNTDIQYDECNLLLTKEAHSKFYIHTYSKPICLTKNNSLPIIIGCENQDCVNKTNRYFCSRSCKNGALKNGFITEVDIQHDECNLLLTLDAHNQLFSKKSNNISLKTNTILL